MNRKPGTLIPNERALLAMLNDGQPHTVRDLSSRMRCNEATVYRRLYHLAHDLELVAAEWWVPDDPWADVRPRRSFYLTDNGKVAAKEAE